MRQLTAFIRKEFVEMIRTGKAWIILLLFVFFGIMSPAAAKLTPWFLETFSESMESSGLAVRETTVDAFASWTQFYKNIPMAMFIFGILFSTVLTGEYQQGTLVNVLTKGMKRWKVIASKGIMMTVFWTVSYWLCFGITFAYTVHFWDNSIVKHPFLAAFFLYLEGLLLIAAILFFSAVLESGAAVLGVLGGGIVLLYLLEMVLPLSDFLPLRLFGAAALLNGGAVPGDFIKPAAAAGVLIILLTAGAVCCFNKKKI